MNRREMLKKTMALVKTGDQDAFENFYILTVRGSFKYACSLLGEGKDAQRLLAEVYALLYRRADTLPVTEKALRDRILNEIDQVAYKRFGVAALDSTEPESSAILSDELAASIWLAIEQRAGFREADPPEEQAEFLPCVYSFLKVALAAAVLTAAVLTIYAGWNWISKNAGKNQDIAAATLKAAESVSVPETVLEEEKLQPGWEQRSDGKLYYVKRDKTPGSGMIAIGKQLITCSRDGELTLIGENKEVTDHPDWSFDEDIRYQVKSGDIYRKAPGEDEILVVGNGHITQADIRCGYLWYIAEYQIPNTSRMKVTVYRADPDGRQEQEIYSTEGSLETGSFQVTANWFYYIKDRALFRRNLKTEHTEFLADQVDYYFAWEDTAFYMNGRTLESVSKGSAYTGVEDGCKIELADEGFVLYDAFGNPVEADENENGFKEIGDRLYQLGDGGVIQSVGPAPRKVNGVTYQIDHSRNDKIVWRDESGSQGLLNQEGLSADCLCVTNEWLYYSGRIAEMDGETVSQLYRVNLQSMELQKVGESFQGYLTNLYYFDKLQTIFGEYIPSTADPDQIHGRIAVVPVGGEMRLADDSQLRSGGGSGWDGSSAGGSDMFQIVMADSSHIYCFYHHIYYDESTGKLEFKDTVPVVIQYKSGG